MLTQEQVLQSVASGERVSECLDLRDFRRLAPFFPVDKWQIFNLCLADGAEAPTPRPWTREEVLKQLAEDVDFGFEKALDRRGISAEMMYEVVRMWLWVLEDDLQHELEYAMYGLPLFKKVAVKYGFPNLIGDDLGSEEKYNA